MLTMEAKKVIYATNLKEPTHALLEGLLDIKKIGLEEIILLSNGLPQGLKDKLFGGGIKLKGVEGSGTFVPRLLDSARKENASLIVAHLRREKRKILWGSTVRKLIQHTPLPLLLVNDAVNQYSPSQKGIFENVVLATDWSAAAQKALNYIISLSELIGVLDIVNVLNEKPTVKDIRQLKERIEGVRKVCLEAKIDAESHVYAGKTPEEILLAAKDYTATVIVMGTGCKSTLRELYAGSASYRVAEEAPVPVLIIP